MAAPACWKDLRTIPQRAGASPSLESTHVLIRHVHRRPGRAGRIIELIVAPKPAPAETAPHSIAEVIPFPVRRFRDRDLSAEVVECFREAKHGRT